MLYLQQLAIFFLAGLCEIGGGYPVWQCRKAGRPAWMGLLGASLLVLYGWVATWQPMSFGKTCAVYGGIFSVLLIAWAWYLDGFRPARYYVIGGAICFGGIGIIFFWPRS